jgi:hypothetical protein
MHNKIFDKIVDGYFTVVAGNQENMLEKEIAEIRYCDRLRRPAIFKLMDNKRIFPGVHSNKHSIDPLLECINWAKKEWTFRKENRIVIIRSWWICVGVKNAENV